MVDFEQVNTSWETYYSKKQTRLEKKQQQKKGKQ